VLVRTVAKLLHGRIAHSEMLRKPPTHRPRNDNPLPRPRNANLLRYLHLRLVIQVLADLNLKPVAEAIPLPPPAVEAIRKANRATQVATRAVTKSKHSSPTTNRTASPNPGSLFFVSHPCQNSLNLFEELAQNSDNSLRHSLCV
jgi:hypothetical protein